MTLAAPNQLRHRTAELILNTLVDPDARKTVGMPDQDPPDRVVAAVADILHRWLTNQLVGLPRFLLVATIPHKGGPWYASTWAYHKQQVTAIAVSPNNIGTYPVYLSWLVGTELADGCEEYLSCEGAGRAAWGRAPEEPAADQRPQRAVR